MLQEIHRAHIELAKAMLAETDWPVKHIAGEAGFSDENQMLRLFKKHVNTTPGAYRKHLRLSASRSNRGCQVAWSRRVAAGSP